MKTKMNKIASIAFTFALLLTLIPAGLVTADNRAEISGEVGSAVSLDNDKNVALAIQPAAGEKYASDDTQVVTEDADGGTDYGNTLTVSNNDPSGFNISVSLSSAGSVTPNDLEASIPATYDTLSYAGMYVKASATGDTGQTITIATKQDASENCVVTDVEALALELTCDIGVNATGDITITGDDTGGADTYVVTIGNLTLDTVNWATSNDATATAIASLIDSTDNYSAAAVANVITVDAVNAGTAENVDVNVVTTDGGGSAPTATDNEMTGGLDAATYRDVVIAIDTATLFTATGGDDTFVSSGSGPTDLTGGAAASNVLLTDEAGTISYRMTEGVGLTLGNGAGSGAGGGYISYVTDEVFYRNTDPTDSLVSDGTIIIDHLLTGNVTTKPGTYLGTAIYTIAVNI